MPCAILRVDTSIPAYPFGKPRWWHACDGCARSGGLRDLEAAAFADEGLFKRHPTSLKIDPRHAVRCVRRSETPRAKTNTFVTQGVSSAPAHRLTLGFGTVGSGLAPMKIDLAGCRRARPPLAAIDE